MTEIRIWAPFATRVDVVVGDDRKQTTQEGETWVLPEGLPHGTTYSVSVDRGEAFPDPRSRRQPNGVHGDSQVVDTATFAWTDGDWPGMNVEGKVLYELHVGTFTPSGTFRSAIERLDDLVELGVDMIELMPIAPMPGQHGWGYDGVSLFAIHEPYGAPEDLVALVDAAHARGLGVCLDVVYNHFGPDGNYLQQFGPYSTTETTIWGGSVNVANPHVRQFVIDNVMQWLRDYHFDAMRLDAVAVIKDPTDYHILAELSDRVAELGASLGRKVSLIAESDLNEPSMVTATNQGGMGMDAQWTDDVHHALHAWLTGERQAYYLDFHQAGALERTLTDPFFHAGTMSTFRKKVWGSPVPEGMNGHVFVVFDENHDQVGNRAASERPSAKLSLGQLAVSRAIILTSPYTPMLFMGEEWGATTPFPFFSDHGPELGPLVSAGRANEFKDWDLSSAYDSPVTPPDPQAIETFLSAKLEWSEAAKPEHARLREFVRALIALRRSNADIGSGDRSQSEVRISGRGGWMRRGNALVVFSLEAGRVSAPVEARQVELAWDSVDFDAESVQFADAGVAIFV